MRFHCARLEETDTWLVIFVNGPKHVVLMHGLTEGEARHHSAKFNGQDATAYELKPVETRRSYLMPQELMMEAYALYPRHEGKVPGFKNLRNIEDDTEAALFIRAVKNYANKCKREATEKQFILLFSTFTNGRWRDYIDVEAPAAQTQQAAMSQESILNSLASVLDAFTPSSK